MKKDSATSKSNVLHCYGCKKAMTLNTCYVVVNAVLKLEKHHKPMQQHKEKWKCYEFPPVTNGMHHNNFG